MAGIRGTNTKPELVLRRGLHAAGFRFRLHDKRLPGKPDIALPRWKSVVLANGCFWHGHDCHLFRLPATRPEFWAAKIARNREVDKRNDSELAALGWRRGIVWECALKGRTRLPEADVLVGLVGWLRSDASVFELRGTD